MKDTRCTKFLNAKQVNSCVASIFSLCTTNMSTPSPCIKRRKSSQRVVCLSTSCFASLERRREWLHPLEIHINVYLHSFNNKFFPFFNLLRNSIRYIVYWYQKMIGEWDKIDFKRKILARRYHVRSTWLITISWRYFFLHVSKRKSFDTVWEIIEKLQVFLSFLDFNLIFCMLYLYKLIVVKKVWNIEQFWTSFILLHQKVKFRYFQKILL